MNTIAASSIDPTPQITPGTPVPDGAFTAPGEGEFADFADLLAGNGNPASCDTESLAFAGVPDNDPTARADTEVPLKDDEIERLSLLGLSYFSVLLTPVQQAPALLSKEPAAADAVPDVPCEGTSSLPRSALGAGETAAVSGETAAPHPKTFDRAAVPAAKTRAEKLKSALAIPQPAIGAAKVAGAVAIEVKNAGVEEPIQASDSTEPRGVGAVPESHRVEEPIPASDSAEPGAQEPLRGTTAAMQSKSMENNPVQTENAAPKASPVSTGTQKDHEAGHSSLESPANAPTPIGLAPGHTSSDPVAVRESAPVRQLPEIAERVGELAARMRMDGSGSAEVRVRLDGGHDLVIRIERYGDQLRPIFKTDSPVLREALESGWNQFSARAGDSGARLTTPVFESPDVQSGMQDLGQRGEGRDSRHSFTGRQTSFESAWPASPRATAKRTARHDVAPVTLSGLNAWA